VRGVEALRVFSDLLVNPFMPPPPPSELNPYARIEELEAEVAGLRAQLAKR